MYYVGFDIGGTKCAASLGLWRSGEIKIIERVETPTEQTPEKTLDALSEAVEGWVKKYSPRRAGISCGGPLDSARGIIISTPNLSEGWHGFNIVSHIKARFGLNASLENDANASAVAEWKFGAGVGTRNMVFMTFGTGLGAGIIVDGRLYSGTNGNAGEIGHIRLSENGPLGYGKEGSAEGFCSGGGIKRLALLRAKERGITLDESITAKAIFERAGQGDSFCASVIKESGEKFAVVISLLIDLLNPELIVAGGVFMRNYELFMNIMKPIIEREALPDSLGVCKIMPAKIGENIGDFAALAIAVSEDEK